jgi:hypothetical protein
MHSNVRELTAVFRVLTRADLSQVSVQLFTDNTSTVSVINKQGTLYSISLQKVAQELFDWLQFHHVRITAAHIPGSLNIPADMLSRSDKVFQAEWSLEKKTFRWICNRFNFQPQIDVFATHLTTQLPLYFSPVPDAAAVGLDAMAQAWDGWKLYLFPPLALYSQVVMKLRSSAQTTALVVYPNHKRKIWYPLLTEIMLHPPIPIPIHSHLLHQPHSKIPHPNLKLLNLHAALCRSQRV